MDEHQWIAPLWLKNDGKRKDICYTYPDWGNAGPGIVPPTHQHTGDDLQPQGDVWTLSSVY